MTISSRTPEGDPNRCPVCGAAVKIEPSNPPGDAPCPCCGHLLWFRWMSDVEGSSIRFSSRLVTHEALASLIDHCHPGRGETLWIDFEGVEYLGSHALGVLISLKKKLGLEHARLRIRGLHPDLREVFRMTRLDHVLGIEND